MSKFAALALATERASRCLLKHPVTKRPLVDGEGRQAYVDVLSLDSAKVHAADLEIGRNRIEIGKLSIEDLNEEVPARLAAATTGWFLVGLDGAVIDVPFTADNARDLYSEPALNWIREAVLAHARDRGNFVPASSAG